MRITIARLCCLSLALACVLQAQETAPKKVGKATLVVLPTVYANQFRIHSTPATVQITGDINLNFKLSPGDELELQDLSMTQQLIQRFNASNKFKLLDREHLKKVIREIDFGASKYGDTDAAVKAGNMLNANYVLATYIKAIYITAEEKEVPYTDMKTTRLIGRVDLDFQVTDVKTGEVMLARPLTTVTAAELDEEKEIFPPARWRDLMAKVYGAVARSVVDETLAFIYPIKVVQVTGQRIYINRGETAVEVGDVLDVFRQGEAVIDPDTGEVLGSTEEQRGTIKVVDVKEKMAIAAPVEPGLEVSIGDLCRESAESIKKRTETQKEIKIDW